MKKVCRDCEYSRIIIKGGEHKGYKCQLSANYILLNDTCKNFQWTKTLKEEMKKENIILMESLKNYPYKYYTNDKYNPDNIIHNHETLNCKEYNPIDDMSVEDYYRLKKIYKELLALWENMNI